MVAKVTPAIPFPPSIQGSKCSGSQWRLESPSRVHSNSWFQEQCFANRMKMFAAFLFKLSAKLNLSSSDSVLNGIAHAPVCTEPSAFCFQRTTTAVWTCWALKTTRSTISSLRPKQTVVRSANTLLSFRRPFLKCTWKFHKSENLRPNSCSYDLGLFKQTIFLARTEAVNICFCSLWWHLRRLNCWPCFVHFLFR